jgi:hypothetical protein
MSTATVKLKHGALATVTPDFTITRGITETHSLTLLNADNTALTIPAVVTWTFQIAQDFLSRTSILAESTSITFTDNVLSGILLNAHTVELKAFMQGKAIQPLYGTLIGLNGSAEVVTAITFRIVCTNSVYEPDAEPTPAIISQFYTAAQVDAKFADIGSTLNIPSDINELDDEDGLISSKVESVSALPTPAVALLNRAYFLTADDGTSKKGTTWKCVASGESYVMQQIQTDLSSLSDTTNILAGKVDKVTGYGLSKNDYTDAAVAKVAKIDLETLTELTGTEVSVVPWTQSKWSASGTCSLTASGWAVSGHQVAYVLITLADEATLSISGATVADDDALSTAGIYACYLINENGTVRFKVAGFTEAV